jgi:lipopolysaccharide exporter
MLRAQILKGMSWLFAGRLAGNLLGLASTLIAARLLVPEDFGLMAIGMGVLALAGAVVDLPVGAALVQMKNASKADFDTAWTINLLRSAIVSALMLLAAWPAGLLIGDMRAAGLVAALAAYPLLTGLRNAWFEQYIRDMDFRREALVDVLSKLASLVVMVWIAWATRSYWALAFGVIAGAFISTLMTYVLRPQLPAFSLRSFSRFFHFSIWVGLGSVADSFRDATTTFFIGRLLGNAKLGFFAIGSQFGERLELVLYAPLERTLFAAFSSIQDDLERVRGAYLRGIHAAAAVILPVCLGIGLIAPELIALALGPDWSEAALVLAFIAPATALYLLAGLSNSLTNALGHPKALFRYKLVSALPNVPALALGITQMGLTGALWACVFTAAGWYLFSLHVAAQVTGLTRLAQISVTGRSLTSSLVMAAAVWGVRALLPGGQGENFGETLLNAAVLAAAGAAAYAACHLTLWQFANRPQGIESMLLAFLSKRAAPD